MTTLYRGPAREQVMEPLLRLASIPAGTQLIPGSVGHSADLGSNGDVQVTHNDGRMRLTFRGPDGTPSCDLTMEAFGDTGSQDYWYPLSPIGEERVVDEGETSAIGEAAEKAREFLQRVTFFEDDAAAAPPGSRAAAAVNYMRLRSEVTEGWIVSLAAPHELILDDETVGEGGLIMAFGDLPPGLSDLGECALVELAPVGCADLAHWYMRPIMCCFDGDAHGRTVNEFKSALVKLGFTEEDFRRLDEVASQVAAEYEFHQMDDAEGCY